MTSLLVVAGEASGDRAAAGVVSLLSGVSAFGLGGAALANHGVELVEDLRSLTALGIGEAGARMWPIARAFRSVVRAARSFRPRAALLVNYTEFNARLARRLHADGVRVLWYIAPQVWAWRPHRAATLGPRVDRMAVVLPFEERIWRAHGVDASYVGHPVFEAEALDRANARQAISMTPYASAVALMPGSRPHEVRRLLVPMLEAYERVRSERASVDARVLVAPSLDARTHDWLKAICTARRVPTFDVDPSLGAIRVLRAFDASLCASGTASLEAALARATPVIAYRVGLATELAARLFVRTAHLALPNVLLGRRVFAELIQRDARPGPIAAALEDALDRRTFFAAACSEVDASFGPERRPSAAVAAILEPWLALPGA